MENRSVVSPDDIIMVRKDRGPGEKIVKLYSNATFSPIPKLSIIIIYDCTFE